MRSYCLSRLITVAAAVAFISPRAGHAQTGPLRLPADKAVNVNPDAHLVLTFPAPPAIGKSGKIRVFDAADHRLVDSLDLSIPAGPDPARRVAVTAANGIPLDSAIPTSPRTTTPAVRFTPADIHNYQVTTIGGLSDFHFYPIIVRGNTATISLHNNVLRYNRKYIVQIDPGVLVPSAGTFDGYATDKAWTFSTKAAPPRADVARVVVADDGSGDFNTVQGAADFVPDNPARRVTIFIKNGTYEEIVFIRNKKNLTIRGEDRDKVQVGYANNSGFNPPQPGPNRRCAFTIYESTDIQLENFSVSNYAYGQAEGLLISGSRNIVSNVTIKGSGDALNTRGSVYLTDCKIIGDGDTILGVGPAFFNNCEIQSLGPFMWIRNTDENHGNVFVNSTFIARERAAPATPPPALTPSGSVFARLPNNNGINYPYAEAVLINCRLKGIPAIGWGPIGAEVTNAKLWEFNSTDMDRKPVDTTQRHPVSKQLTMAADAQTIANYSNPAYVLGGWTPVIVK
ncbi:MAG: pectinesterase family protein [Gemmatimonadota bacterium]